MPAPPWRRRVRRLARRGTSLGNVFRGRRRSWLGGLVALVAAVQAGCSVQQGAPGGGPVQQGAPRAGLAQDIWRGVDISYINELEDCGAVYRDGGTIGDPFEILARKGANVARFRLWHAPEWTEYSTLADVAKSVRRAKANGMRVLLDFHYSDDWADPQSQKIPAAWRAAESTEEVAKLLYDYTVETLTALETQGLLPDYVQVGNEINHGVARHDPARDSWERNRQRNILLLNAGISAVRDVGSRAKRVLKAMLHVAQPENVERWLDAAASAGLADFDIIGVSYYSKWSQVPMNRLGPFVHRLRSKYGKEVVVVETAYPWTLRHQDQAPNILNKDSLAPGYPASKAGQRKYLLDQMRAVLRGGGLGVVYWEPAWISSDCKTRWGSGSHWENAALFDYRSSNLHKGADFLGHDYSAELRGSDEGFGPSAARALSKVTFKVDMTGVEDSDGAYVTGSFSGPPDGWAILPMTHEGGGVHSYRTELAPGSEGGYYFLRRDDWDARESVPRRCAKAWNIDRKYAIPVSDSVYAFEYGSCNRIQ